jgi:molecular chaperone DnaK (HSP70)
MSIDLGVYFGGSSMVIAYSREDKLSVIVNEAGDRSTPSVLAINSNEYSVGLPAKHNLIRNSKNTIQHSKHFIGKRLDQIDNHLAQKLECQVVYCDCELFEWINFKEIIRKTKLFLYHSNS